MLFRVTLTCQVNIIFMNSGSHLSINMIDWFDGGRLPHNPLVVYFDSGRFLLTKSDGIETESNWVRQHCTTWKREYRSDEITDNDPGLVTMTHQGIRGQVVLNRCPNALCEAFCWQWKGAERNHIFGCAGISRRALRHSLTQHPLWGSCASGFFKLPHLSFLFALSVRLIRHSSNVSRHWSNVRHL